MGLGRVRTALERLGDPQKRFAAVQIAGTNGKGSTAAMTEAILRGAGLRTGLYTSPHLARFTERIRVAGREVDGERLAALDARVVATGVPLTYFEIATVLGFLVFAEEAVDAAVLETGLGGRLDAVTAAEPLCTAITSIGIDHTAYLGTTLAQIAREKAGILKPNVPCLLGRLPEEAHREIARRAAEVGAPLRHLGADFSPPPGPLGLGGPHQRDNAAIATALARAVAARLGRPLDDATVAEALAGTSWPGRLERVGTDLLLDCAHNAEGARALAAALAGDRGRSPGRLPDVRRRGQGRSRHSGCAGASGVRAGGHPGRQPARAPRRGARHRSGAVLPQANRGRRSDRRARRGAPARGRRAGRRLRLDVPGRPAAGRAAGRAGRSAADL